MPEKSSGDEVKKDKEIQLADVEFEVLMEFQRQVIKKYGSERVSWFLSAIIKVAELKMLTPNDAMKSALEDFDQFIKNVEKNCGPIPAETDQVNESDTDLLDDIKGVDKPS
ncbi:MAG: hypothetical protein JSU83_10720 [Deltaproteobacteria bacterium]|nr:MAG: hypothetical protein JSU83_10720 [Deltaproteobacteria bacterium]